MTRVAAFLVLLASSCLADVFLHNPRGSNNRNNEANEVRNNALRLFESYNIAKGGYANGPPMVYYEGSLLNVEFAGTEGSKDPRHQTNFVLQYMCTASDADPNVLVRDGTTTDSIPDDANGPVAKDANGNLKYGMHEPRDFYSACQARERNRGLYIADRADPNIGNLVGNSATCTRQNNNGGRRGYECPEERDYYPYWHPSPWKDVAILTDNTDECLNYTMESQNVQAKGFCRIGGAPGVPNNRADCTAAGGTWDTQAPWGIPAPVCQQTPTIEDGEGFDALGAKMARFDWTLPTADQEPCITSETCSCVLRIRYNITGGNLLGGPFGTFVDATYNGANSPIKSLTMGNFDYPLALSLALDPESYSRVHQDRSFVFQIRKKPANVRRIFNLNVKGKRGNGVQAYPAVEYDYSPDTLVVNSGDYIHFQWTGCDTNPSGYAGEGTSGTDRTNIVQIESLDKNVPASDTWLAANKPLFATQAQRALFSQLGQANCLTWAQLLTKNGNNKGNAEQDVQNCMKLNAAPRYFDGGLVQMNNTGQFYFMNTRNNAFGFRSQKGAIIVN